MMKRATRASRVPIIFLHSTEKSQNFSPKRNLSLPFSFAHQFGSKSCNGLLCLDDFWGNIVLWNPLTMEFKFLPQSCVECPRPPSYNLFNSSGFGFDPKTQDYKVVRFVQNIYVSDDEYELIRDYKSNIELYSLKDDSWKVIKILPDSCIIRPVFDSSIYVNGFYYWVVVERSTSAYILSFDLTNEDFSTLPLPRSDRLPEGSYTFQLVEFHGLLGAMICPKMGIEKSFDLFVMNGGSWTRELVIHVPGAKIEKPLGFWKNYDFFFEGMERELLVFDRATGELKNLGILDFPNAMQLIPLVENIDPFISSNSKLENREAEMVTEQAESLAKYRSI